MNTYTTEQEDMFDLISYRIYGTEKFANVLMRANPAYAAVVKVDAGIALNIPEVNISTSVGNAPWSQAFASN